MKALFRFVFFLFVYLLSPDGIAQQKKSIIQRTLDWGYRIVEGDSSNPHSKYLVPIPILSYRPESKWIFGISTAHIFRTRQDSLTRPSTIRLNIAYSQLKQFSLSPYLDFYSPGNKIVVQSQFSYTSFGEFYWGIGKNTPEINKEFYHFNMQRAYLKTGYLLGKQWYAGLDYYFEKMYNVRYETGSNLKSSGVQGAGGYLASGLGWQIYHDNRDNLFFPYKGNYLGLSQIFFSNAFGSRQNFSTITLEAKSYHQMWKENILAFHFLFNSNTGSIPFRMMGTIGSNSYMRGYYQGRYRDNNAFAFQTEFRKTIWGPLSMVVFAGAGSVASQVKGLTNTILPNAGVGLRMKAIPRERLNMRIDYGFGSGGNNALYITLHEAF